MIPYSDPSEPGRIFPYVNIGLIVVNFLVFFYELSLGISQGTHQSTLFIYQYGLIPCEYTGHCQVFPGTPSPYWFTFLSSMFMHGGWLHILGNMLFLWVFGDNIENSMGHVRYFFFYLLCGAGANALEIATSTNSQVPGLGASGAIAGILGAYLLLYPRSRIRAIIPLGFIPLPVRLPAWIVIVVWFLTDALLPGLATLSNRPLDVGGVAYWAHVGGFATGCILIWVFRHPRRVDQVRARHYQVQAGET